MTLLHLRPTTFGARLVPRSSRLRFQSRRAVGPFPQSFFLGAQPWLSFLVLTCSFLLFLFKRCDFLRQPHFLARFHHSRVNLAHDLDHLFGDGLVNSIFGDRQVVSSFFDLHFWGVRLQILEPKSWSILLQ